MKKLLFLMSAFICILTASATVPADGWTGLAMSATGDTLYNDGDTVWAWSAGCTNATYVGEITVNDVTFSTVRKLNDRPSGVSMPFSINHSLTYDNDGFGTEGVTDAGYAEMLCHSWWRDNYGTDGLTYTLNNLEVGKKYLVQLVFHRNGESTTVSVNGDAATVQVGGTGWKYGGTLVGVFSASATTYSFTITTSESNRQYLNAIQLRQLGAGDPVDPSIGSVTAVADGPEATISLANVAMGTDAELVAATSYAVHYKLGENEEVTALENESGTSAAFTLENLTSGDYACQVWIMTDQAKSSPTNTVSFTVDTTAVNPAVDTVGVDVRGTQATISLAGVTLGTDAQGRAARKYTVNYKLGETGEAQTALADQSEAEASFKLTGLADGDYVYYVWIVTDKEVATTPQSVAFSIASAGDKFQEIKAEIESAGAGDTITIPAGVYTATETINISNAVTIVTAVGRENVVFDAGYPEYTNGIFKVFTEGVKISGLTLRNTGASAIDAGSCFHGLEVKDCVFTNCHAMGGAAIYGNFRYSQYHAQDAEVFPARGDLALVSGCTFEDCETFGIGQDGYAGTLCGAFWIENSTFDGSAAAFQASTIYTWSNLMVTNCVFRNCAAAASGDRAAIYNNQNVTMKIVGCTFSGMTSFALAGYRDAASVLLDRCEIVNCAGSGTDENFQQLLYNKGTVRSTLVHGNEKPLQLGKDAYENCTFVDNVGGFVIMYDSSASQPNAAFTNCVFSGNVKFENAAYTLGDLGLCWHGNNVGIAASVVFASCAIEGASSESNGLHDLLAQDPTGRTATLTAAVDTKGVHFRDVAHGNWAPSGVSPLVNAGVSCAWMAASRDLAGHAREIGSAPDVGAYEYKACGTVVRLR